MRTDTTPMEQIFPLELRSSGIYAAGGPVVYGHSPYMERDALAEIVRRANMHDELVEALLELVYLDDNGCWRAGIRGDADVTDIVGAVLAKVEGR